MSSHIRSKFILSIILLLSFQTPAFATERLDPFKQEFKMTLSSFRVSATRSLTELDDGTYEFRLYAKNFMARYEEKSLFLIDEDGQIFPIQHSVNSKIFGVSRSEKTLFDWESKQATYTKRDTVRTVEIEPGVLDRSIYQLLVPQDLTAGATEVSYDFVDRGRIKNYTFEVVAEEQIKLVDTELTAVRMNRTNQEDQDKQTDIWFASEHQYKLVKISHVDKDGSDYHMLLKGEI